MTRKRLKRRITSFLNEINQKQKEFAEIKKDLPICEEISTYEKTTSQEE
jgi:hypothetical protein